MTKKDCALEFLIDKENRKKFFNLLDELLIVYLSPITSWKKALNNRKQHSHFIYICFINYLILSLLFYNNIIFALRLLFVDVIFTIIPFITLLPAFYYFVKKYNKTITYKKLFLIIFLIKLQIAPFILILLKVYIITNYDDVYILIQILIVIIYILFTIVIPFLINVNNYIKSIWIFINYISFQMFLFLLITISFKNNNFFQFLLNSSLKTPQIEYQLFNNQIIDVYKKLDNFNYYTIVKNNDTAYEVTPIFIPTELAVVYLDQILKYRKIQIAHSSLIGSNCNIYERNVNEKYNYNFADSVNLHFTNEILYDISICDTFIKETQFIKNKEYYISYKNYLNNFYMSNYDIKQVNYILENSSYLDEYLFNSNIKLKIYEINDNYLVNDFVEFEDKRYYFEKNQYYYELPLKVYFYPLLYILEFLDNTSFFDK